MIIPTKIDWTLGKKNKNDEKTVLLFGAGCSRKVKDESNAFFTLTGEKLCLAFKQYVNSSINKWEDTINLMLYGELKIDPMLTRGAKVIMLLKNFCNSFNFSNTTIDEFNDLFIKTNKDYSEKDIKEHGRPSLLNIENIVKIYVGDIISRYFYNYPRNLPHGHENFNFINVDKINFLKSEITNIKEFLGFQETFFLINFNYEWSCFDFFLKKELDNFIFSQPDYDIRKHLNVLENNFSANAIKKWKQNLALNITLGRMTHTSPRGIASLQQNKAIDAFLSSLPTTHSTARSAAYNAVQYSNSVFINADFDFFNKEINYFSDSDKSKGRTKNLEWFFEYNNETNYFEICSKQHTSKRNEQGTYPCIWTEKHKVIKIKSYGYSWNAFNTQLLFGIQGLGEGKKCKTKFEIGIYKEEEKEKLMKQINETILRKISNSNFSFFVFNTDSFYK